LPAKVDPRGVSWFFDHAETVSEQSLDRIAELGGSLSVQNRMMFQGRAFVDRYGAERAALAPPIKRMLERGLVVAAGTDATRVASYNPWLSLEWLVRGRDIGGLILTPAKNRVDRDTALRMYTAGSAALTGESAVKGIMKEGYYADLAILSDDYFSVAEEAISHIESVLTVVGGKVVYSAAPYEGIAPPAPVIAPPWSPVAHFGGFYSSAVSSGLEQAETVAEVAAASDEQLKWRFARGEASSLAAKHSDHSCSLL
jgi:predicted amidohydrolase YtcJ